MQGVVRPDLYLSNVVGNLICPACLPECLPVTGAKPVVDFSYICLFITTNCSHLLQVRPGRCHKSDGDSNIDSHRSEEHK